MRRLLWFTVGFSLSCAVGIYILSGNIPVLLALAVLAGAVGLCFVKTKAARTAAAVLLGLGFGLLWIWLYNACYLQAAKDYDGQSVSAQIEITDYSYDTAYGIAAQGTIVLDGKEFRVQAYLSGIDPVSPGDVVKGSFRLRLTTAAGEEGGTYHQGKGVFLLCYSQGLLATDRADKVPAKYFAAKLRQDIVGILETVFPEDTVAFAKALLLGDSTDLSYETDTAFKLSGIRHVIAVSGLHVAILFSLVYLLAGKHRVLTAVLGIPALVLFAAVAGFTPSIVRACIMQGLMMLAMLVNREYDPPTALAFAVLVILGVNPMAITSVSFQMSVGCIVGIFWLSEPIRNYIAGKLGQTVGSSVRARLARWLSGGVSVTVSAMVFTTPLAAYYFGTVSIVGILTNLLTLWAVSLAFYGIVFACALGALWLPVGKLAAAGISWLMRYVLWVAKLLAKLPFAAVYTCSIYVVLWIVACYILLAAFLLCKKRQPGLLVCCMAVCLAACLAASYIAPRLDDLRVSVFDVGQGQSVLLQSGGKNYLVDCGGDDPQTAADTVAAQLRSQGIMRLDGIVLTHYDTDHAGGVIYLLTQIGADVLYLPDIPDDTQTKAALKAEHGESIQWVRKLTRLTGEFGTMTLVPGENADENESCLCILFQAAECDILITGDRSTAGEQALMDSIALPKLELLVAGHHGSPTSTGFPLLYKTTPQTAVISVGADNAYGHPAAEVLERLELFNTRVRRTDLEGTVIFRKG